MVRRKTNRRHMTGDHQGRTSEKATLQVRAADEILGTHRPTACTGQPGDAVTSTAPAKPINAGTPTPRQHHDHNELQPPWLINGPGNVQVMCPSRIMIFEILTSLTSLPISHSTQSRKSAPITTWITSANCRYVYSIAKFGSNPVWRCDAILTLIVRRSILNLDTGSISTASA